MIDLARATRELHEIGRSYEPKETKPFRKWDDPLDGVPRCFLGDAPFDEVHERTQALLDRLDKEQRRITIHADLHRENVLRNPNGLVVLDFEMSCLGWPVLDVSTTVYDLRFGEHASEIESAYWRGLGQTLDDLGVTELEFNLLLAARQYVLVNDVYQAKVAEFVAVREQYREVSRERIKHFLATGTFNPKVCKMNL